MIASHRDIIISFCNIVLEDSMHNTPKSSADAFLTTLNSICNKDNALSGIDLTKELTDEEFWKLVQ